MVLWTNGVSTQIRFRNHNYSTLMWKNQSYYQSRGSEFRYRNAQSHLTRRSASNHCVLRLNLIKGSFNIVIYTHTHTSIHLVINMASIIPKTLTYIYNAYHIILSKVANNKISQGQKHRHGNIKETCDCILDIKNTSSNQTCSTHH